MAAQSIKQRVTKLANGKDAEELRFLLAAIVDALQAVAAKLDADEGVTSTDYAASVAALIVD